MCHHFFKIWASLRISLQDLLYEVSRCIRNSNVLRERVAILANSPVRGFHVGRLEGWLAYDQRVNDYSEGPDVYLI